MKTWAIPFLRGADPAAPAHNITASPTGIGKKSIVFSNVCLIRSALTSQTSRIYAPGKSRNGGFSGVSGVIPAAWHEDKAVGQAFSATGGGASSPRQTLTPTRE